MENRREMGRKHDTHHPPPIFLEPPRKKRWPRDSHEIPVGAGSWPARQRWAMGLPSLAIKVLLQPGQLQHRMALFIRNDPKGSSHGGTQGLVAKFRQCHPQPGGDSLVSDTGLCTGSGLYKGHSQRRADPICLLSPASSKSCKTIAKSMGCGSQISCFFALSCHKAHSSGYKRVCHRRVSRAASNKLQPWRKGLQLGCPCRVRAPQRSHHLPQATSPPSQAGAAPHGPPFHPQPPYEPLLLPKP